MRRGGRDARVLGAGMSDRCPYCSGQPTSDNDFCDDHRIIRRAPPTEEGFYWFYLRVEKTWTTVRVERDVQFGDLRLTLFGDDAEFALGHYEHFGVFGPRLTPPTRLP